MINTKGVQLDVGFSVYCRQVKIACKYTLVIFSSFWSFVYLINETAQINYERIICIGDWDAPLFSFLQFTRLVEVIQWLIVYNAVLEKDLIVVLDRSVWIWERIWHGGITICMLLLFQMSLKKHVLALVR